MKAFNSQGAHGVIALLVDDGSKPHRLMETAAAAPSLAHAPKIVNRLI
jgi:hypothetical protein